MAVHFCASLPCTARQRLGDGRLMELRLPPLAVAEAQQGLRAELAQGCRRCPFHLGLRDMGCAGVIRHPISAAAERWLLKRLPDDLDEPAARQLLAGLQRAKADGLTVDRLRALHRHYELRRPAQRRWGPWFSSHTTVSSSQLLQVALHAGSLLPSQARLLAGALGYLDEQHRPRVDADMASLPQDDASVRALKHFLSMTAAAGQRGAGVFISLDPMGHDV